MLLTFPVDLSMSSTGPEDVGNRIRLGDDICCGGLPSDWILGYKEM